MLRNSKACIRSLLHDSNFKIVVISEILHLHKVNLRAEVIKNKHHDRLTTNTAWIAYKHRILHSKRNDKDLQRSIFTDATFKPKLSITIMNPDRKYMLDAATWYTN
jgi:hypothetical protein